MKIIKTALFYFIILLILYVRLDQKCEKDILVCVNKDLETSSFHVSEKPFFVNIRNEVSKKVRSFIPSPHSELLLGMVMGVDDFSKVPIYKEILKKTGTIHVVVVSGYNISLVFALVLRFVGSQYRLGNVIIGLLITLFYSILSGFDPPVIRSWIMGLVIIFSKYVGVKVNTVLVLIFTCLVMLIINPFYLYSLSFQLSFLATFGLVLYTNFFDSLINKKNSFVGQLLDDLKTTVSAQILVWPLIAFNFKSFSTISPLVNALTLWLVPISTILGGVIIFLGFFIGPLIMRWISILVYVPLNLFIFITDFFSRYKNAQVPLLITTKCMFYYYLIAIFLGFIISGRRKHV